MLTSTDIKGIIFDFNGTLYWDSELHYEAWRKYSKILRGYEFSDEEMREKMFGHTNEDIIEYATGQKPTQEMLKKYSQAKEAEYRACCLEEPEKFKLAPGVVELLDFLKKNNIPRTIATMSEWDNVEFYIQNFHLEHWFDIDKIVYSDGTIPGKPAPDIFQIAAQKIGLKPENCVIVEDAIAGIEAAFNAHAGKIIAIASLEPIEYYKNMNCVNKIIKNFYEFDTNMFEV